MNFNRLKLSTKLIGAFVCVCLMGAVVSAIGIRDMGMINDRADVMYEEELMGLSLVKEANVDLLGVGRALRNVLLSSNAEQRNAALGVTDKKFAELKENLDKAKPLFYTDAGKAAFADLGRSLAAYTEAVVKLKARATAAKLQDTGDATAYLFGEFASITSKIDGDMESLAKLKQANAKHAAEENGAIFAQARGLMIGLVAGALLLGIGIGMWLTRSLTRQLGAEPSDAAELAQSVAAGDLSTTIALRPGDTTSVMAALQAMQLSLIKVVANVRQNSDSVATASSQIAQGNLDLSQRTEEQAAALEETAASMEELSSTVKQNADNARQANQLAQSASSVAVTGGETVTQVVDTMRGINTASKKIADIISVIDGIAFQTNILALNAAVEAARAGEQGRGFAVVASEVRSLAGRSADAAKEIKSLINASVERVEQGTVLVDQAGTTMNDVVASIKRVTDIMGEISAASVEQSAGVAQVGEAVTQMDQATQQNAALVEESAAAAESLKTQALQLVQAVAVFKLSQRDGLASSPRLAAPASSVAQVERRSPSRATNVTRPAFKSKPAEQSVLPDSAPSKTGTDDWASF